ncbi:hypothetical protein [Butyrivibrio proteoclasticus]|uniref:hypothetical protein n=1 Tax=Butyrivibrio proteoclasticus TaxID=43305 RepID=UPI000479CDCF|nr:hypothetical protein [Butyrivibrio proteoclasticus]
MKKFRLKHFVILFIVIALVGGVGGLFMALRSQENGNRSGSGNGKVEVAPAKYPEDANPDKQLLASLYNGNWGLVSDYEGYWSHTNYYVYYDGTIETTGHYCYMGIDYVSKSEEVLSTEELNTFKKTVKSLKEDTTNNDACDGDCWGISVFDEEGKNLVTVPTGYVYGNDKMEKTIIPILYKHSDISWPITTTVEDMPGFANACDKVYLEFSIVYSDKIHEDYIVYYNGKVTCDDVRNGVTVTREKTFEEEEFKRLQFLVENAKDESRCVDSNDYYTYTVYNSEGEAVASAGLTDEIFYDALHEIEFAVYISTYNNTASAKEAEGNEAIFTKFLNGDRSLLKDGQEEEWFIPDFKNSDDTYEYTFSDLDQDGEVEMIVQMEDEPGAYVSIFHIEDGKVVCWFMDNVEQISYSYPLDNGLMVNEYDYDGSVSYGIFRFNSDGEQEYIEDLFIREEESSSGDAKCPDYQIDQEDIDKEAFEDELQTSILDHMLDKSAWTVIK